MKLQFGIETDAFAVVPSTDNVGISPALTTVVHSEANDLAKAYEKQHGVRCDVELISILVRRRAR